MKLFSKWISLWEIIIITILLIVLSLCFYFYNIYIHNNLFAYILFIIFFIVTIILWLISLNEFIKDIRQHSTKKLNDYEEFTQKMLDIPSINEDTNNYLTFND